MESERFVHKILCTVILKIVNYPLESERETVSEQFQGSWRLGTAQALHAQYKYVSSVDISHLGTPYERVPRFLSTRELINGWKFADPVIGTVGVKADMRYFGKTLKNRFQHDIW